MEADNVGAQFGLTSNQSSVSPKVSRATWAGLAIALFAMVAIRQVFVFFVPETTFASAVLKEALIWVSALALIVIIRRSEHLPMSSIRLGTARWWKSILWGFAIAIVSAVAVVALAHLTGYGHGPGSAAFEKLPLWLITAIVLPRRSRRGTILPRLRHRTVAPDWPRPLLVGGNSAGDLFAWPLVRRRRQYPHRICSRIDPDRILSVAPRSGGKHDRTRPGGFCC